PPGEKGERGVPGVGQKGPRGPPDGGQQHSLYSGLLFRVQIEIGAVSPEVEAVHRARPGPRPSTGLQTQQLFTWRTFIVYILKS
ncbi:hypothetical protein GOODEAATRI_000771, partial [Goodea atripinnis]